MKKFQTHYDNLKISRYASQEEIKLSYRRLMQQYHPDKNSSSDAERISKMISIAYKTLSNPITRKEHDNWIDSKYNMYSHEKNTYGDNSYSQNYGQSEQNEDEYEEWKKEKERKDRSEYEEWKKKKVFTENNTSDISREIHNHFMSNSDSSFYVGNQIPNKKIRNFIKKAEYEFDENLSNLSVFFYYDETLFGSGDAGIAVTNKYLITIDSMMGDGTVLLPLRFVQEATVQGWFNKTITINTTFDSNIDTFKITLTQGNKGAEEITRAINFIKNKFIDTY